MKVATRCLGTRPHIKALLPWFLKARTARTELLLLLIFYLYGKSILFLTNTEWERKYLAKAENGE